jgi:hypothetical protein
MIMCVSPRSPIMDNRGPQLQKTSGKDQHVADMTKDAMKKDSSKDLAQAKEPSRPSYDFSSLFKLQKNLFLIGLIENCQIKKDTTTEIRGIRGIQVRQRQ